MSARLENTEPYKQTSRNIEALDANKKAVILSPLDAEAYTPGTTLSELGRLDEAEANYRKVIALNPYMLKLILI